MRSSLVSGENRAIDLESGELSVNVKQEGHGWGAYVCGHHEGKYLLRCHDGVKW